MTSLVPGAAGGAGHRPFIRLIVNADDFGISERVNAGIVLAHRTGIVTATSLMAVGRAFGQAVAHCRKLPFLDVGVHLTLVAEKPLLPNSGALTEDDGHFPISIGAFLRRCHRGKVRLADIQAELSAQIERVLDHGIRVTHLDSHQHVHALPWLAPLTRRLAAQYGIPFVRVPVEDWRAGRPQGLRGISRLLGAMLLRASWAAAGLSGTIGRRARSPRFLGFQEGGRLDHLRLQRLLRRLRPGRVYELMCHPGFTPDEPAVQRWNYSHEKELQALTSPAVRAAIADRGIQLCSFKNLMAL
jgi:predicted glycoside hydrolase/deacetylase ChbG (UPF0249 family)